MGSKSGVLVQNEKQANKAAAKVMRITFIIFTLVYILNVLGIFIVDMKIMTTAYVLGSVLLWLPTVLVNIAKRDGSYVKYALTICAVIFITICDFNIRLSCSAFIHIRDCHCKSVFFKKDQCHDDDTIGNWCISRTDYLFLVSYSSG